MIKKREYTLFFPPVPVILIITAGWLVPAHAQTALTITDNISEIKIAPENIYWLVDKTGTLNFDSVQRKSFNTFSGEEIQTAKNTWAFWTRLTVNNQSSADKDYVLQFPKWGKIDVFLSAEPANFEKLQTGSLKKLNEKSIKASVDAVKFLLKKNTASAIYINFQPAYSIYLPADFSFRLQPHTGFIVQDTRRLFWQGIFIGIIVIMALYNLIIFFGVKDISYLYYVLSIVGVGLYFIFYYGFGIEYLWPHRPLWDTWSYTIIVPFTGMMRLLFTRTYLHTPQQLPLVNRLINFLFAASSLTMLGGYITFILKYDILKRYVVLVGMLGILVLMLMLGAGIVSYYKKQYKPAGFFITANVVLVVGAIAFILREIGVVQDNFITRYLVQVGVLIQVIVFALGLTSRYNRAKMQLAQETIEKEKIALERERDKKNLIEQQRKELQLKVEGQTKSLMQKNRQLEETIIELEASKEKLSELNQIKDKLFSIISHDLRNPLATMQSYLKLITEHQEKLTEEEKKQLMTESQDTLNNLNQLLFNLLQWSRSQMNLLQFNPEKINLKYAVSKNVRLMYLNAQMKNISIDQGSINDSLFVNADKDMLDFILRNLISNAIKFSNRNGVIRIKANQMDGQIWIRVEDNGVGMTEDKVKQLLQFNAGSLSKRGTEKERGTGLGLMICKEFIEKNGGQLNIESEPSKGSVFSFSVPDHSREIVTG